MLREQHVQVFRWAHLCTSIVVIHSEDPREESHSSQSCICLQSLHILRRREYGNCVGVLRQCSIGGIVSHKEVLRTSTFVFACEWPSPKNHHTCYYGISGRNLELRNSDNVRGIMNEYHPFGDRRIALKQLRFNLSDCGNHRLKTFRKNIDLALTLWKQILHNLSIINMEIWR